MKFKVTKEEIQCVIAGYLKNWTHESLPDFITLEGELVEGGGTSEGHTSECFRYLQLPDDLVSKHSLLCSCPCHGTQTYYSKGEQVPFNGFGTVEKCTPEHPNEHCSWHNKKEEKKCPHWGVDWFNRETPKLPSKLEAGYGVSFTEHSTEYKVNEVIDYLTALKERNG